MLDNGFDSSPPWRKIDFLRGRNQRDFAPSAVEAARGHRNRNAVEMEPRTHVKQYAKAACRQRSYRSPSVSIKPDSECRQLGNSRSHGVGNLGQSSGDSGMPKAMTSRLQSLLHRESVQM